MCRGPEGPDPDLAEWDLEVERVPSGVDLLQKAVLLPFMASRKSTEVDRQFVEVFWRSDVTEDPSGHQVKIDLDSVIQRYHTMSRTM